MKVEKLELKHLCGYLPYGLTIKCADTGEIMQMGGLSGENTIEAVTTVNGEELARLLAIDKAEDAEEYAIPFLRPLSKLTQEITHNGETFVPLIRLAAIAGTSSENCWYINKENRAQFNNSTATFHLAYDNSFIFRESEKWKDFGVPARQLELFQKLHEWHFDLYSLLESGLALELTTPLQTKQ